MTSHYVIQTLIVNCFNIVKSKMFIILQIVGEISNKKVSKANKSRTLLRYSITYHYDLISLSSRDANQRNSLYASPTEFPYLNVKDTCISMDSALDG